MNKLTASLTGDFTAKSLRLREKSDNFIILRLQPDITEDSDITDITYTIDQTPQVRLTLSGGQIVQKCEYDKYLYQINIPSALNIKRGYYDQFIQIDLDNCNFESSYSFTASLDKGRVRIER